MTRALLGAALLAGCPRPDYATTVSVVPDQPPNAAGTQGTARFQLDGLQPPDAELIVPDGITHVGTFAWQEADDLGQYWPILEATAPGVYDGVTFGFSDDYAGTRIEATQAVPFHAVDALVLDTRGYRADGGLVPSVDLYAIKRGAVPLTAAVQLMDVDDVPLWGSIDAEKVSDPGSLYYDDLDTVDFEAGRAEFPSQDFDPGTGAVTVALSDGTQLVTPTYRPVLESAVNDTWSLTLVVAPSDAGLALWQHLDEPGGQPVLSRFPSASLSGLDASGMPELVGVELPCGWQLAIAGGQPEHEVVECVGVLCASALVPGTLTVPSAEDCEPGPR